MPAQLDTDDRDRLETAAAFLVDRGVVAPRVALILGSGMGDVAEALEGAVRLGFHEIPHFPAATVAGHAGAIVAGRLEDHPCLLFQGRIHPYEGRSPQEVTFPVRLAHRLGAGLLLATNAAGGIAPDLIPGSLMLLAGHVSLLPLRTFGVPTTRTSDPYDEATLRELEDAALRVGVRLRRGTYAWAMGPSYETRSEIEALRRIGADAVGMSTIPEVLQAHALGMQVAAISAITNRAAGLSIGRLSHGDVLRAAAASANNLQRILQRFLRQSAVGGGRSGR